MRVVHNVGWYLPDSMGGTERYVESLVRGLVRSGVECVIAAATDGKERYYDWNGTAVYRYRVPGTRDRAQLRGHQPHGDFDRFAQWLRAQKADVYHQHSWTRGCGRDHLEAARTLGYRTVVTVHVPSLICLRGTMMEGGHIACDGHIGRRRCGRCWAASCTRLPVIPSLVGSLSDGLSRLAAAAPSGGALGSALAARALAEQKRRDVQVLGALTDKVVAVCGWLRNALLSNGIPSERLVLMRHGVHHIDGHRLIPRSPALGTLRVGYLGRITAVKGVDVLVRAVKKISTQCDIELHIRGHEQTDEDRSYGAALRNESKDCDAIHWLGPLDPDKSAEFFEAINVLAVPSVCMETGPLVVLEAHAARVPVLGSRLGGITELVDHGRDGLLVAHGDVKAWGEVLRQCTGQPELLAELRAGIGPVRSSAAVVEDTLALYSGL